MDLQSTFGASLALYSLSALAQLVPAILVYPRIARRSGGAEKTQYARSAAAWAAAGLVLGAAGALASLPVLFLHAYPKRPGRRGSPWQGPLIIGQAVIFFVLSYAKAYAKHLNPSHVELEQDELDMLVRQLKARDPKICYPIEDGWPHDLRRLSRRHALYSMLWAALILLGMVLMAASVYHTTTAQYFAIISAWLTESAAQ